MTTRLISPEATQERADYYDRIQALHLCPLWEQFSSVLRPEPKPESVPHLWNFDEVRAWLMQSADLISQEEAERRVLYLENPGLTGRFGVTESLFAGLQLILPGEVAAAHRHSPSALRFIVEGNGAYTSVNGEKIPMAPGDLVLTPSWAWHDHGNEGDAPVIWLDVLDLPLIKNTGVIFLETMEQPYPTQVPAQDSIYRWGSNMLPAAREIAMNNSPLCHYPYVDIKQALDRLHDAGRFDDYHGIKMEYVNPTNGNSSMATISTFVQMLPAKFKTRPYRTTEGNVYCVIEGHGSVVVETDAGEQTIKWGPRDIFVIPTWQRHSISADSESVLFNASDRTVQQKLGIWREQRDN